MQILKGQKATVNVHKTKKRRKITKKILKNPVLLRKSQEPEVLDVPVLDF